MTVTTKRPGATSCRAGFCARSAADGNLLTSYFNVSRILETWKFFPDFNPTNDRNYYAYLFVKAGTLV